MINLIVICFIWIGGHQVALLLVKYLTILVPAGQQCKICMPVLSLQLFLLFLGLSAHQAASIFIYITEIQAE